MDEALIFILRVSLMAIPLYMCNGLALIFGGKKPIDFGMNFFDGKPLLGKGKTFKGTFSGIFFASLAGLAISLVFPQTKALIGANYFYYAALLAGGAVLGDFVGSFLKRRIGLARGKSVILLDQLDFVAGGIALSALLVAPNLVEVVFLMAFTMVAHVIGNHLAFFARIKNHPW